MNNYTLSLKNGIKFAANQRTGKVLITLNGYIKLSGKPKQTITERTTRAFLVGTVCEAPLKTEENGRMRLRNHKLIPLALACDWLGKDNPELAKAIDGDLMGWLSQPQDLSQFHKAKAVEVVPVVESEIVSAQVSGLTVLDFGGKGIRFERRGDRVWVSLTDMAKATGKLVGHWNALSSTTEFLKELESIIGIPIMVSNTGGLPETTGTWAVEEIAIDFAAWCNVSFRIWVAQQIRTLMTEGAVAIAKPEPEPTPAPAPQLTYADRLKIAIEADKLFAKYGMDSDPRFRQSAQDFLGNILGFAQ